MAQQVSDLIVERLLAWGVDTIFGFPGDGVDGFFESLRTHQDKLKFIQVRHEEAAAFAAVGYAKYTGRLGVCCATSGPGGVHLLNGLYDAKCDQQPVLAITGHTFSDMIGMDYQQDVDLDKLFMDVTVFNQRINSAPHAINVVDMAVRSAYGRRGVAHICIPKDIQEWKVSNEHRSSANVPHHSGDYKVGQSAKPAPSVLQKAADVIKPASTPANTTPTTATRAARQTKFINAPLNTRTAPHSRNICRTGKDVNVGEEVTIGRGGRTGFRVYHRREEASTLLD